MFKKSIFGVLFSAFFLLILPNLAKAEIELISQNEIEERKAEIEATMIDNFGLLDNVDEALEEIGLEVIETVIEESTISPLSLATNTTVSTSYK